MRTWNGSKWIRPEKRQAIYQRDEYTCVYCGADVLCVSDPHGRTLDHVRPVELGGSNAASNLVTCCLFCNTSKQNKTVAQFIVSIVARAASVGRVIDAAAIARNVKNATRRSMTQRAREQRISKAA